MTDVESYFWIVIPINSESKSLVLRASMIIGCIAEQDKCIIFFKPTLHPTSRKYLTFGYHDEIEFSIEPFQKFKKPIVPYTVFEQYKKIIKKARNVMKWGGE
jgi:hypothetical protein